MEQDLHARHDAALALSNIADKKAVELLIKELKDDALRCVVVLRQLSLQFCPCDVRDGGEAGSILRFFDASRTYLLAKDFRTILNSIFLDKCLQSPT
jgi:hypothetical protein